MSREDMIQTINEKFKEISIETIMFHKALADVLGLHITDHKSLELIHRYGSMPAGRLADLTGLTTGGVTGIIDRLEEAGYVRRVNDPKDRRRTIIEPTRNKKLDSKLEVIFKPLHERTHMLLCSYSDSELTFLIDVTTKLIDQISEESKRIRDL